MLVVCERPAVGFREMDIVELIETALGNIDHRRVDMTALEPADLSVEATTGLVSIISELVGNATEFSADADKVRVTGRVELGGYLLSISDHGVGMSEERMDGLNRVLEDPGVLGSHPETTLGIYLVAGLAARHGITVRLVPGVPGVTARVSIPSTLIEKSAEALNDEGDLPTPDHSEGAPSTLVDLFNATREKVESADVPVALNVEDEASPFDDRVSADVSNQGQGWRVERTQAEKRETQAFLERVFAPLLSETPDTQNGLKSPTPPNGEVAEAPISADTAEGEAGKSDTSTTLQVRVPGKNIPDSGDDILKIKAGEEAVDIKSALSSYDQGRQSAQQIGPAEDEIL